MWQSQGKFYGNFLKFLSWRRLSRQSSEDTIAGREPSSSMVSTTNQTWNYFQLIPGEHCSKKALLIDQSMLHRVKTTNTGREQAQPVNHSRSHQRAKTTAQTRAQVPVTSPGCSLDPRIGVPGSPVCVKGPIPATPWPSRHVLIFFWEFHV